MEVPDGQPSWRAVTGPNGSASYALSDAKSGVAFEDLDGRGTVRQQASILFTSQNQCVAVWHRGNAKVDGVNGEAE